MNVSLSTSDPFGRTRELAAYAPDPVTSNVPNSGSVWPTPAGSDRAVLDTNRALHLTIAGGRALRALPLALAAECQYVGQTMHPQLISRLRERALGPKRATDGADSVRAKVHPCMREADFVAAERALGFSVPTSIRHLYAAVGNGGFGPAYGLLGLMGGASNEDGLDAVHLYLRFRLPDEDDPHWAWPDRLLPLGHLGCAMLMCVDCSTEECRLVWFEPNPHSDGDPWTDSFIPFPVTLIEWLERWLDGAEDLFETAWNNAFGAEDADS